MTSWKLDIINPANLGEASGYSNGIIAPAGSRMLAVAGQVAWDRDHRLVGSSFAEQFGATLSNVLEVVRDAGGNAACVASLRIYVTDKQEYLAELEEIGVVYRRLMGRHYPAMALVEVSALLEDGAKLEIEGLAFLPPLGGYREGPEPGEHDE